MVTDEQLKANSIYQYGYVEKYHIVDPGNQDPVEFGRLYDELGWEFVWEAHRRRDMIRFGLFTKKSWLSHKPILGIPALGVMGYVFACIIVLYTIVKHFISRR